MRVMNEPTEVQERRERIKATRDDASALLNGGHHETIKGVARLALRDLDEGEMWLMRTERVDQRPWILAMIDHQILLAASRLDYVRWALKEYGPNVELFGG